MKTAYKTIVIFAGLIAASGALAPETAPAQSAYFQQEANYVISVKLDADRKMTFGEQTLQYVNNSPDTLTEFYLHLYPNAFRGKESEYMQFRNRRYNRTFGNVPEKNRSWTKLRDVTVDGDTVQVEVDDTLARLQLPKPLLPGDTMEIRLKFDSKIRKRFGRAGYVGDHYDYAQWYPKAVVYDQNGFHLDKHKAGEFYGEFGTFDVTIELPTNMVVAATGTLAGGDPGWDYNAPGGGGAATAGDGTTKTVRFHAENVHDFAWCADPTFVVQDSTWNGVEARVFYRKRNEGAWKDTTMTHTIRALEWLTDKVGPYGYPQVSVVDVPSSYGMEYPMLVMNGRASEGLVLHELAHIYFYGMLANDERAEPWLDEGFATFMTTWYKEERYGPFGDTSKWNWYQRMTPQYRLWEGLRHDVIDLQRRGYGERVGNRAEDFQNSYRAHVYQKSALIINYIRYVTGDDDFKTIVHNYYDAWQYLHVNEDRFRRACEEWAHQDLSRGFEQWLHTKKNCDYKLVDVKTTPRSDGEVDVKVDIDRIGELYAPIKLVFEFENGDTSVFSIESRLRAIEETYRLPSKPKRAGINPRNEIMDVNLRDNFQPRQRDFQVDWPNNSYYPEWGYQFRHRPGAWYNDIDGLKAGYMIRGSYLDSAPRWRGGVYYGFVSERVDFDLRYDHPTPGKFLGHRGLLHVSGWKMEGRQDATMYIKGTRRTTLTKPPTQEFIIGLNYHELTDPQYLPRPHTYDTNKVDIGLYFTYNITPEFDWFSTPVDAELRLGREWFGGDFRYERFTTTVRFFSRPKIVDFRFRLFLGLAGGEVPLQQQFQLGYAGPLATEQHFWLRSPGAVPPGLHYQMGGDGNLRGYFLGSFGVNRLFSTNVELGTPLPLFALERITKPLVGPLQWYAFYDVGWIMDPENPNSSNDRLHGLVTEGVLGWTLQDAGVGFASRRLFPFWDLTMRLDLPFWVSHPEVNDEEDTVQWRYVFSLSRAF